MFGALGLGRKPETFQLRLGYAVTTEHAARVAAEALPPTPAAPPLTPQLLPPLAALLTSAVSHLPRCH